MAMRKVNILVNVDTLKLLKRLEEREAKKAPKYVKITHDYIIFKLAFKEAKR